MNQDSSKDNKEIISVKNITSSMSSLQVNKNDSEVLTGSDNSFHGTADLHSTPVGTDPAGNLNLPHVRQPRQKSPSSEMQNMPSCSVAKVDSHLTIDDLEVLSTIG